MPKNVCLYFHIGECLGYCEKNVNQKALENMEKEILEFLRGNDKILIDKIIKKIETFSNNLNFEAALELKKELDYIKVVLDKQKVELHDYINRDVIGFDALDGIVSVQILFIRNGKIIGGNNDKFYLMSDLEDEVNSYILKYYERHEIPKEILVEDNLNSEIISNILNTKVYVPIKGKKKNLVEMAHVNAKISLEQEMTIIKNDDYNTMREVIYRRYYRCMVEKLEMPDLILVDGGINQINACKSILDELHLPIKVCGLRKDDHHRTNELIDGDTLEVIKIPRMSDVFHYLTRIQDEVHRYTINYHKQIRSKGSIASVLDNIEGIGKVRKKELIKKYGSIKKMKEASIEELSEIIPENVAKNLEKYLESRDSDDTRKE